MTVHIVENEESSDVIFLLPILNTLVSIPFLIVWDLQVHALRAFF